jgi:glutamate synthase (ferredoxin)
LKRKTRINFKIKNTDRSVGAILSNEISKIYGAKVIEDTILVDFEGSGQSFGHLPQWTPLKFMETVMTI